MVNLQFRQNVSLKEFNTFGLDIKAQSFLEFNSIEQVQLLRDQGIFQQKHLVLGGGSNILLVNDFDGIVLKNAIAGQEILETEKNKKIVEFGAGENWHQSVLWSLSQNLGGLENLSLIPGTVGAAPMQNIGAYGVEIKDVFLSLSAFNKTTGLIEEFDGPKCEFGYRESVFKHALQHQYIICKVRFKLHDLSLNANTYKLNTSYGAIQNVLLEKNIAHPSAADVSKAVISIRQSKLPNPAEIGNSGSFFKNPVVDESKVEELKLLYPDIPHYSAANGKVKLAAGWLIEQCGWKGKRRGDAGSHAKQALVLVNYGNAKGEEIWQLALDIQDSVLEKFAVKLETEVNLIR